MLPQAGKDKVPEHKEGITSEMMGVVQNYVHPQRYWKSAGTMQKL